MEETKMSPHLKFTLLLIAGLVCRIVPVVAIATLCIFAYKGFGTI